MDGGSVTAPHFAFYSPESQWEVENHGVAPDIEIDLDPAEWRNGRDTQLEKAVEVAMAELRKNTRRTRSSGRRTRTTTRKARRRRPNHAGR